MEKTLELRSLGNTGLKLSCVGFGASPLGSVFGPVSDEEAIATVREAFRLGINFFDTSPLVIFTQSLVIYVPHFYAAKFFFYVPNL